MFNLDASSVSIKIKVLAILPFEEPPTMYYLCDLVINLQACHLSSFYVVGICPLDIAMVCISAGPTVYRFK